MVKIAPDLNHPLFQFINALDFMFKVVRHVTSFSALLHVDASRLRRNTRLSGKCPEVYGDVKFKFNLRKKNDDGVTCIRARQLTAGHGASVEL